MKNKYDLLLSAREKLLIAGVVLGTSGAILEASLPCFSKPNDVKKFGSYLAIGNQLVPVKDMGSFIQSYIKGKSYNPNQMILFGHPWPIIFWAASLIDSGPLEKLLQNQGTEMSIPFQSEELKVVRESGNTPMHVAAVNSASCLKALISNGRFGINTYNNDAKTPLYLAMACNNQETIDTLLAAASINVNAVNACRRTILHVAVMNGDINVVEQLVALNGTYGEDKHGLEINAKDDLGKTPADYLTTIKNTDVRKTIQRLLHEKNAQYGNGNSVPNPGA
jgi:ankyrin repeat protein